MGIQMGILDKIRSKGISIAVEPTVEEPTVEEPTVEEPENMSDAREECLTGKREACPCCLQKIKKLNPHGMGKSKWKTLDDIARLNLEGNEWVKVESGENLKVSGEKVKSAYRASAHASVLVWFGLLESSGYRSGEYRVSKQGKLFLAGNADVPRIIYCRDGEVLGETPERVTVAEIKGVVFSKDYWDRYGDIQVHECELPTEEGADGNT